MILLILETMIPVIGLLAVLTFGLGLLLEVAEWATAPYRHADIPQVSSERRAAD